MGTQGDIEFMKALGMDTSIHGGPIREPGGGGWLLPWSL
jgi:hypothetical protein